MKIYIIKDKYGVTIDWFDNSKDAKEQVKRFEGKDKRDGTYKADSYKIVVEEEN